MMHQSLKQIASVSVYKHRRRRRVIKAMSVAQDTKTRRKTTTESLGVQRHVDILLIEDNPQDARITVEAFRDATVRVHSVETGDEALRFLRREPPYSDSAPPNLIVLDLNLNTSAVNGYDVLTAIKADADLKTIPVLVLSGSDNPAGIDLAYALQASVYLRKPMELDDYFAMVQAVKDIWLRFARLPRVHGKESRTF